MNFSKHKKLFTILGKIFITVMLMSLIYSQIDFNTLKDKLLSVDTTSLFYAFICHLIAYLLFAIRYTFMLSQLCKINNYLVFSKWYYFGLFCNNYLPTSFGGDVVRIYFLRKQNYSLNDLIVSSFSDRLIGFASILLMGLVAIVFNPFLFELNAQYIVSIIAFLVLATIGMFFIVRMIMKYESSSDKIVSRVVKKTQEIIHVFSTYNKKRHRILLALFISFTAQVFIIMCYSFLGYGLNLELGFMTYFAIIPIVFLATAIPITVGGLGIREGALISLLGLYSIGYDDAAALSVLYLMVITTLTLPALSVPLFRNRELEVQVPVKSEQ